MIARSGHHSGTSTHIKQQSNQVYMLAVTPQAESHHAMLMLDLCRPHINQLQRLSVQNVQRHEAGHQSKA
jgi:hypothetical protein